MLDRVQLYQGAYFKFLKKWLENRSIWSDIFWITLTILATFHMHPNHFLRCIVALMRLNNFWTLLIYYLLEKVHKVCTRSLWETLYCKKPVSFCFQYLSPIRMGEKHSGFSYIWSLTFRLTEHSRSLSAALSKAKTGTWNYAVKIFFLHPLFSMNVLVPFWKAYAALERRAQISIRPFWMLWRFQNATSICFANWRALPQCRKMYWMHEYIIFSI